MLKKEIKYKDFDGSEKVEVVYLHLNKLELMDLELEHKNGFSAYLNQLVAQDNKKAIFNLIKSLVLLAYGVRTTREDGGVQFIKDKTLTARFSNSRVYEELFIHILEHPDEMETFFVDLTSL